MFKETNKSINPSVIASDLEFTSVSAWFKTEVFVPFGIIHSKDKKNIKIRLLQSSENLCQHYNSIATNKAIAACCLFLE